MLKKGRFRHVLIYGILKLPVKWFVGYKFNYKAAPAPKISTPCLILANHNSNYDMLLVASSFKKQMYFVSSEHIFRWGLLSKIIYWCFAPISRAKGATDGVSALNIIRMLNNGYNVCLFAEGNRSFNGLTCQIHPTVGRLAKMANATLVTYKLEGLYLSSPRWCEYLRRGKTRGECVNIYTSEKLKTMTAEEVNAAIAEDLYEDAFERQQEEKIAFKGKALAEKLETALYICPRCGKINTMHSQGDKFFCDCGFSVIYNQYGFFEGENVPFDTVAKWDKWQTETLGNMVENADEKPFFSDEDQYLRRLGADHSEEIVARGELSMSKDRFSVGEFETSMANITHMSLVQREMILFSADGINYEIRSNHSRNGRKYITVYNILKGQMAEIV